MSILREKVHDERLLRLIAHLLQAGYLEDWRYQATYSGSPQGSIVSPVLANSYLSKLDSFVETVLLPQFNRGDRRRINSEWRDFQQRAKSREKAGHWEEAKVFRKKMQAVPSLDPQDPNYRLLRYLRYADDFLRAI